MNRKNEKLDVTQAIKNYLHELGVEVINNAHYCVYMHGSMRGITAAISRLLDFNPGFSVKCMNTALIKTVDEETAIVNACVIFEQTGYEGGWYSPFFV